MNKLDFKVFEKEEEAFDAFSLRKEIFVREQGIPEHLDYDQYDPGSYHLVVYDQKLPIATARLTLQAEKAVLSRIAVVPAQRGKGLGVEMIQRLEAIALQQGIRKFSLRPHTYLENFYKSLGYMTTRNDLSIEGIALLEMEKEVL